jgi:hypothetical protein
MSAIRFDADQWRSASDLATSAHLTGPFAAGSVISPVELGAGGRVRVAQSRFPMLLVALRAPLDIDALRVDLTLVDAGAGGGNRPLVPAVFSPYSETGAALPVHAPAADPGTGLAPAFEVRAATTRIPGDGGAEVALTVADARDLIEFRVVSGNLGRLSYCVTAEQSRMRRMAREIGAMRMLERARDEALDRHGADLAVPRLTDRIAFAPPPPAPAEPPPNDHRIVTLAERESDASYRRRLGLYRPLGRISPLDLRRRLNGPGADGDPNGGPIAELGVGARFSVIEDDNPFAVSIRLVGTPAARTDFLDYLRRIHLVWPAGGAAANAVHRARYLPGPVKTEVDELRKRLRTAFDLQAPGPIAPLLATSLDRVGQVRRALVDAGGWPLLRAQDDAGGSRYELGIGVDVQPLPAAQLNALGTAARNFRPSGTDPALDALITSLVPRRAAEDPDGRWLLEACGLRTVHRVAADRLYLSHLPIFGLVVDEGPGATPQTVPLEARYHAPGDPGANAALVDGLAAAATAWQGPAWTVIPDAEAAQLWGTAVVDATAEGVFRAAGLLPVRDATAVAARLSRIPAELHETLRLAPAMATRIRTPASSAAAVAELRSLVEVLRSAGLSSVLPLALPGGGVLLIVGVIGLPEVGLNLTDRRATGFRWYAVPIRGSGGTLRAVGSRTEFQPKGADLTAIVTLGYVRGNRSDPFEYRLDLPDGALLSLEQYEFLMNLVARANPIGVEINTFAIRRRHIDLDGDGRVDPLDPSAARTFRRFHRPRHRGEAAVTVPSQP